jgi:hypothetical protein
MYLKECLEKYNKKIKLYVDMDGVLADYEVGKPLNFRDKRPLFSNIKKLEEIAKMNNVEIHILSVCVKDYQIEEKNDWLDKYAPFFEHDKRTIISRESNSNILAKELKTNYLNSLEKDKDTVIVLIDDDNSVLWEIHKKVSNIIVYQDSVLRD